MSLIRISESDDWIVDYDRERGMYRVSYFEGNHFKDEYWFDCFEEKEVSAKDTPMPVERFKKYNHEWWVGYCPRCDSMVRFDFDIDSKEGNRKCHCVKCGQLCDFEDR